jgi:hypothetical protein
MKKLLAIMVLGLLFSGNAFAKDDKEFFISCSAKGYQDISYKQQRFTENLFDEYKITIGEKPPFGRLPKSSLLVNTNANKERDFYLQRNPFDKTISYSDKIMIIDEVRTLKTPSGKQLNVHQEAVISLISGVYEVNYKDQMGLDDTIKFSGIGKCKGLVPMLSYIENKNLKSSYLDYWWAVILIIAITFFIFTQSGKRLKQIRRK